MKQASSRYSLKHNLTVENAVVGLLFLAGLFYLFCLLFPTLHITIFPGVDSWTYALSYLPQRDISFGKDVAYTYGPLGYLVSGSLLPENYQQIAWFKFTVHSLFLVLAAVQFWRIKSLSGRLFWLVSLFGVYHTLVALDYLLVLGYLLILSWIPQLRGRKGLAIALLLGGWAGFSALVKFTAGVMTFGALLMYWLGHLYPIYRSLARGPKLQEALVILLTATGSAMAVTFVGLHGNLGLGLLRLLPSAAIALAWGWGTQCYLKDNPRCAKVRPSLGWFSSLAVFGVTLTAVVLMTQRPSMLGFVLWSLQFSSGYSSAMSLIGSSVELALAIAMVVMLLTLFVRSVTGRSLGLFLALTFILWIVLKHGFVRQDAHVFMFFFVTPFLLSVARQQRPRRPSRRLSGVVMLLMLALMGLYWQFPGVFGHPEIPWNLSLIHKPRLVLNRVVHFDFSRVFEEVQAMSNESLMPVRLSDEVNGYLQPKTVDVMPWEIALIPANNLNWQPRRTLQSYAAYTTRLDNWTAQGVREQPPEAILYDFVDLDGRHPFVSEPATLFEVFSRYQLSPEFPEFIPTELQPNLMLLEPRPESRSWLASPEVERRSLSWNEAMTLPQVEGQMLRGAIAIKESFLGKIIKTLLRAAPVRMRVTYTDGSEATYRILPTTSENGVILSHLPRSPQEGLAFWQGLELPNLPLPAAVDSIAFETDNPLIYRSGIDVTLTSFALKPSSPSAHN